MGHKQDREQFMELLFKQNYNRIYQYCFLKLGPPPQDAEDCAMETLFPRPEADRQSDAASLSGTVALCDRPECVP